jgi:crotonobetainyl-CoA:carnitine CoA-transferase CaiB-like acyl-CoA transferase
LRQALAQLGESGLPAPDQPLSAEQLAQQAHRNELANETNPDPNAAVATATAALLALYHRARTGEGQAVETSMLCSNAWVLSADWVEYPGRRPREVADLELHGLGALYRLYATAEGWVFLACPGPAGFAKLCRGLGAPELASDPSATKTRAAATTPSSRSAAAPFAKRPAAEWRRISPRGVGCVRADRACSRASPSTSRSCARRLRHRGEDPELGRYRRFGPTVMLSDDPAGRGPAAPASTPGRSSASWVSRPSGSTSSCASA